MMNRAIAAAVFMLALGLGRWAEGQVGARLPAGWTVETKRVKVVTPTGAEDRDITYYTNTIGMKMVRIPAGEFVMGSPESEQCHLPQEGPQHTARITRPFFIGTCEVTQEQYEKVTGANPSHYRAAQNPVEEVSWNVAVEFCKRLSQKEGVEYRLPTEAQWEYACRAGTTTPFYTGATISARLANYNGNHIYGNGRKGQFREKPTPAGSFPPNGFGLYDMCGNLREWCLDGYVESYYTKCPSDDPQAPSSGIVRSLRGGCWLFVPRHMRSASRHWYWPEQWSSNIGFRVVGRP